MGDPVLPKGIEEKVINSLQGLWVTGPEDKNEAAIDVNYTVRLYYEQQRERAA